MTRSTRGTLALAVAVACASACEATDSRHPRGPFVVDDAGDTVNAVGARARIVSLVPAVTDLITALGASDRLVARTRFDQAAELSALPSVGGGLDPDAELIASLQPDLVVVWPDADRRSAAGQLHALGLPIYAAEYQTLADVRRHASNLGALLELSGRADSLVTAFDRRMRAVRTAVSGVERPSALYVVVVDPPMIAGPGSFVDSLLWSAGAVNAFSELSLPWPQVSFEAVVAARPEWVIVPSGDRGAPVRLQEQPGWREVEAVRLGRVIQVDADLFSRPGPALAEATEALARELHPDRFPAPPPPPAS